MSDSFHRKRIPSHYRLTLAQYTPTSDPQSQPKPYRRTGEQVWRTLSSNMSYYFAQPQGLDPCPIFPFADTGANSLVVMTRTLRKLKRTFTSSHQVLRSTYTKPWEDFTARHLPCAHYEGPISNSIYLITSRDPRGYAKVSLTGS